MTSVLNQETAISVATFDATDEVSASIMWLNKIIIDSRRLQNGLASGIGQLQLRPVLDKMSADPPTNHLQTGVRPTGRPTILLADDHAIITDGLRHLLEQKCKIVGIAKDGDLLIEMARTLRPELVIVDITMPGLNGIDAVRELLKILPKTKVIFLTMHADSAYVAESFDAGATGFVVKHAAPEELWEAINAVLAGGAYISPMVGGTGAIASNQPSHLHRTVTGFRLSTRQRQVLQLIAEGRSTKQIAARLGVAVKTVEFHKYQIMKNQNITTSAQLIKLALTHGLIA